MSDKKKSGIPKGTNSPRFDWSAIQGEYRTGTLSDAELCRIYGCSRKAMHLDDTAGKRFYKIGMSAFFSARFDAHQCASPFDVCVACAYFVANMRLEESALHKEFSDKRVRGEWFSLDTEDLERVIRRGILV